MNLGKGAQGGFRNGYRFETFLGYAHRMNEISIAILAGGQSRRMGRDKAALPWEGATLLERLARAAISTERPTRVIGRLTPERWTLKGVVFLPDAAPGVGPLGGVLTALNAAEGGVLAVACDMPYLNARALEWLLEAARDLPADAAGVAARNDGRIEPLFSVYGRSLRGAIAERIAAGRLSLRGLIEDRDFKILDVPADIRPSLVNVNTPDEWRSLEKKEIS